jgi:hypothetical protein
MPSTPAAACGESSHVGAPRRGPRFVDRRSPFALTPNGASSYSGVMLPVRLEPRRQLLPVHVQLQRAPAHEVFKRVRTSYGESGPHIASQTNGAQPGCSRCVHIHLNLHCARGGAAGRAREPPAADVQRHSLTRARLRSLLRLGGAMLGEARSPGRCERSCRRRSPSRGPRRA